MTLSSRLLSLLPEIPLLLVHAAGVVAAIILLIRQQERLSAGLLALIGFALLSILDLASLAQGAVIRLLSRRMATGIRFSHISVACCCTVVDMAATACLVFAIWEAISTKGAKEVEG